MLLQQCSLFRVCLRMEFQVGPTLNHFSSWLINWKLDLNLWGLDQSSVRPKPGFRIRNRNQGPILVLVSQPKLCFPLAELFFKNFQIFSCFFLLREYKFLKIWNLTKWSKNLKYLGENLIIGALLWWKKYPVILVTRFSHWNVVLI